MRSSWFAGILVMGCLVGCLVGRPGAAAQPDGATATDQAAPTPFDLVKADQRIMRAADGAEFRVVLVAPSGPAPAKGYPVLYVMDGNNWVLLAAEIVRTNTLFSVISQTEPAVVVGIGYPGSKPDMLRRTHDLTPPTPAGAVEHRPGERYGGDVALMDFMDKTVKPYVASRFPIDSQRQTLVGHSLGGLFVLRNLFTRPASYQTYVALSPSIWWGKRLVLADARRFERMKDRPGNLRVFMSVGEFEQSGDKQYAALERRGIEAMYKAHPEAFPGETLEAALAGMERIVKEARMVDNARELALELRQHGVPTEFQVFAREDHLSVLPVSLGRAVPYALSTAP